MQKNLDWKDRPYFYDHPQPDAPIVYHMVEWLIGSLIGFGFIVVMFSLLEIL